ncbi:Polysulfide reductase chain A precursor [Phycisphaerae bacterium RAS1]|nr:Polysulfide reductase chain A precursor [Phycisphaerae bacterium RAS1]
MPYKPKRSWVENAAVSLGLIRAGSEAVGGPARSNDTGRAGLPLARFPTPDQWDDFVEFDAHEWPRRAVPRHYRLAPTTCFNCESACGLLAYIDKETGEIRKFEGNPAHPGSRGKNCAKGPATINQINDPDRILAPLKRVGPRGGGKWQEVSWDEVLADIGGRIRKALQEDRRDEIVYHVGRPGAEGFIDRVLRAWGVDGHNSHTNICSSGARLGYALWSGYDRPSPDYANARFILALNAHLESGHYFNPHAQRISEGLARGAKMAVVDPRLSNTASLATYWLPTRPGTEAALVLAMAHVILNEDLYDKAFIERWVNWRETLAAAADGRLRPGARGTGLRPVSARVENPCKQSPVEDRCHSQDLGDTIEGFIALLKDRYAPFTPDAVAEECGVPAEQIVKIARLAAEAGSRFCSHTWRGAASAHLGGWQVSRCLMLLHALTGSVGTEGGCLPAGWNKYKASLINVPPPQNHWNELHWPREFPLTHYEMSFLLPHFLLEGRGKIDVYFTRVFNPVWTYPDGFTWIQALRDESKIGLSIALTPTWNETAFFADYVLPMGHGPERHDLNTYETHSGTWIAFRQPVLRAAVRAEGRQIRDTRDTNPGKVWEEDEFWIALTWAIDPDGSLGIRKYFESAKSPGTMLSVDEYYEYAFDRVPGLKETAAQAGLSPLDYMRKFGAFEVKKREYERHERRLSEKELEGAATDPATGVLTKAGHVVGVVLRNVAAGTGKMPVPPATLRTNLGGTGVSPVSDASGTGKMPIPPEVAVEGFATPSRRLEFFSQTMVDWGWGEYAIPWYIPSHIWEERAGSREQGREKTGIEGSRDQGIEGRQTAASGSNSSFSSLQSSFLEMCLLPTFRLPTLIHTRSGSAKWLNEISQRNPIWIHTSDAAELKLHTGDLVRVNTEIGYFVDRVWVTEGIRPGVVACSHHLGRWRRPQDPPASRWSGSVVQIDELEAGKWRMRQISGPQPFESPDPDSRRIWWRDGGVHQNITFPVHPDPISGMHCWHQRVTVERAKREDQSGDVFVDTARSMQVYREWMKKTRWPVGPGGLRRPLWLGRPLRPTDAAYKIDGGR